MATVVLMALLLGLFALISAVDIRRRVICVSHLLVLLTLRIACAVAEGLFPGCLGISSLAGGEVALAKSALVALAAACVMWLLGAVASKLAGKNALGFGDVLLFGACCTFVGPTLLEPYVLGVAAFAAVQALVCAAAKRKTFPFAPALVAPCWLVLLVSVLLVGI